MLERAHRQIKDALRARLAGVEWPQHLPWVLLGLRPPRGSKGGRRYLFSRAGVWSCPHPSRAVPCNNGAVACRFYIKQLQSLTALPTRPATYAEAAASVPEKLMKAEYVFVRRGGVYRHWHPCTMGRTRCCRRGVSSSPSASETARTRSRLTVLKPHLGGPVVPAEPPARGCPPRSVVAAASVLLWPLLGGAPVEDI